MTFMTYIFVSILAIALQALPGQTAVIGPGHEAEIENLFSGLGTEAATGWKLVNISIDRDHFQAELSGPGNETIFLDFVHTGLEQKPIAKTNSFDVQLSRAESIGPYRAIAIALQVAALVDQRDHGGFWHGVFTYQDNPASQPTRLEMFAASPVGIAIFAWIAGFLVLLALLATGTLRKCQWKNAEVRRALVEIGLLVGVALFLRWISLDSGPANQVIRLPSPFGPPGKYPELGIGMAAWSVGLTNLFGTNDVVIFFAGALGGAVTVVPVYLLGWWASGRRIGGLVSGLAIAVWPVHAWLCPNDDPAVLIALLSTVAVAAVVAAGRLGSAILLVAGWLAMVLAATFRPEPALAWLPLGLMILLDPPSRRLQFKPAVLIASVLVIAAGMSAMYLPIVAATGYFAPAFSFSGLARILGLLGSESILLPPRTPFVLSCLFLIGLVMSAGASRGRTILWLLVGLLPALVTGSLASTDLVTARYQLALVPLAAVFGGIGALFVMDRADLWFKPHRRWIRACLGALIVAIAMYALHHPPAEPTFRLEYRFFRQNLDKVPAGCRIVHAGSWDADLGMMIPSHLSEWLGFGHHWIEPAADLDPESECLAYWRPATCRAIHEENLLPDGRYYMRSCYLIESSYRLEPISETNIPAITGFTDRYATDPVRVGFYRLRRKTKEGEPASTDTLDASPR